MKNLKFYYAGRCLFMLVLLCVTTLAHAQWDYDYSIGIQLEQKPLGNAMVQNPNNNDLVGVHNEHNGRGFWIYETDLNGQMISSHYYVHPDPDIVLRVYAIEHSGAENIVTGEVDHGNGEKHLFLMTCNANGNGTISSALELKSANINPNTFKPFNTVGMDLLQTVFGANPEFMAVCQENFTPTGALQGFYPNPVRPYVVRFDKNLNILSVWDYPVVYSLGATQARLVDNGSQVHITGEAGHVQYNGTFYYPSDAIFFLRIHPSTGAVITTDLSASNSSAHIIYNKPTTYSMHSPVISSTGAFDWISYAQIPAPGDDRLVIGSIDYSVNTHLSIVGFREYQDLDIDGLVPVQMSQTSGNHVNVLYNRTKSGITNPCWVTINTGIPYTAVQDVQFLDPTGSSEAMAGIITNTAPYDVYFSSVSALNDLGVTYSTASNYPSCNKPKNMHLVNGNSTYYHDDLTVATLTNPQATELDLSLGDPTGLMRDCNGNLLSSFKKEPVGLNDVFDSGSQINIRRVEDGVFALVNDDLSVNHIRVCDLSGRQLLEITNPSSEVVFDLSTYAKGPYMISINRNDDSYEVVKVIR